MNDMSENQKKEKLSFLKWIDNFWYHHKVVVILAVVAIVMITVASVQLLTKKDPDVFIYYVGETNITMNSEQLCTQVEEMFAYDGNEDGVVDVHFKKDEYVMVKDSAGKRQAVDESSEVDIVQRFNLELASGDCVIYIMDPSYFENNLNYLEDVNKVLGYNDKRAVKGKGFRLGDLPVYKNTALKHLPEDYYICVRLKKNSFSNSYYKSNVECFKKMVEYQPNS